MTFEEFLEQTNAAGGLQTEDVLTAFLPLARLISQWHEEGRVAPPLTWEALEIREGGSLALRSPVSAAPTINRGPVEALQKPAVTGLQVVGHGRITSDDDEGTSYQSLDVAEPGATIQRPVYCVGYGAWEQAVGHHDALVDVFSLGMLLAALALGLDFSERTEVERFVRSRDNLFALNERLHPVLAAAIREMTVLDRHQRAGDLPDQSRLGTGSGKSEADARRRFDDAGAEFQQPQADGGELGSGAVVRFWDGVSHGEDQPVGGGVQDQPHLVGERAAAAGAVGSELRFV